MTRASSLTLQWRALIARDVDLGPPPWPRGAVALASAIALLGAVSRVRLYLTNRSLWLDEVFIALNLQERSFAELTKPLDFNQGAPFGFLWIEKAVVTLLGNSEYALRLWPLVLGLASLVLFLLLVRRTLAPVAGCVAMLVFATSPALNYFSSDAKQYGGDVVYVTLVLLLAQYWRETRRWSALAALAVVGVLAPWLSHAALFALGAAGLVLAYESVERKRWKETAVLGVIGASWALTVAAAYALSLGALTSDSQLQGYWNESFAPLPWKPGALEHWRVLVLGWFGGSPMPAYGLPGVTLAIAVLGLALLAARDRRFLALVAGPVALAILASMLHVYPVRSRLMLFAAPLLTILLAVGVEGLYQALRPEFPRLGVVAAAIAAVAVALWSWPLLRHGWFREETRDAFAYVQAHVEPGDVVFVDHWAAFSYRYYRPRFDFGGARTLEGAYYDNDWNERRADVQRVAGAPRAWIVFSHRSASGEEQKIALDTLNGMGRQVGEKYERPGVAVYLFDLEAPAAH